MVIKGGVVEAYPEGDLGVSKSSRRQKWWRLGGRDVSHVSVNDGYVDSDASSFDEDSNGAVVKNVNNVFDAPEAAQLYKPIEGFEGTHRFDPSATWTQAEEKALVRKVGAYPAFNIPLLTSCSARLADCTPGLYHVLRTSARSW